MDIQGIHHGHVMQIDLTDKKMYNEFLVYCEDLAVHSHVDELGGEGSSWRRMRSDKTFDEVIHMAEFGIKCGIKINHRPLFKIQDYDQWEGGYIESFIRMGEDVEHDYFIWQYIRMEHLRNILTKFGQILQYWY